MNTSVSFLKSLKISENLLICLALVVIIAIPYWQVGGFDFVLYDDDIYLFQNDHVKDGVTLAGVYWAFTTSHAANWHPVTWISHMLDIWIFGMDPGAFHLVNVLFHVLNTLLLFFILRQMTGATWASAFVAALFAVHPIHVESVAWISERKDVLSTFFWMLTVLGYVLYVRFRGRFRYCLVLLFFTLGLMAKPMLVTLPVLLLLLDIWPLERLPGAELFSRTAWPRLWCLIREKIPMVLLVAGSAAATVLAQRGGGAMPDLAILPFWLRLGNALTAYVRYIIMMIWPANLRVFYPHSGPDLSPWLIAGAILFLLVVTIWVLWRHGKNPYLMVGWGFYLITLLPVIGLVQVGGQALADRYAYVPLLGLFIMIAWGLSDLVRAKKRFKIILGFAACGIVILMTAASGFQVSYWQNTRTLFQRVLAVDPRNPLANEKVGEEQLKMGNSQKAREHFLSALQRKPGDMHLHSRLAESFSSQGRFADAAGVFRMALKIQPDNCRALFGLADALDRQGKRTDAITAYQDTLRRCPHHKNALIGLAGVFQAGQDFEQAAVFYWKAILVDETDADVFVSYGDVLLNQDKYEEAGRAYKMAVQIRPRHAKYHVKLGLVLIKEKKWDLAANAFSEACALDPHHPVASRKLQEIRERLREQENN